MSDSSSRSTPPPLPSATPGTPPPLPPVAPGTPSMASVSDTKRGWMPPPLPPGKANVAQPASAHASVSRENEEARDLPFATANTSHAANFSSTTDGAPSSILNSSPPIGGDSEVPEEPPPVPKTATALPSSFGFIAETSQPGAQGPDGGIGEKADVLPCAVSPEPLPNPPPPNPPAVQEIASLTPVLAPVLTPEEKQAEATSSERAPAQLLPKEAARAPLNNDTSGAAIPAQSPGDTAGSSSETAKKSVWIGISVFVIATVCAGLAYGAYQWRSAVAAKEALLASRQQEIEAKLVEERVQRERAEAEAAAARRRAAEAEQAAMLAAAAKVASSSEPVPAEPYSTAASPARVSVALSQELLPLAARFDVSAGLPLLKEMVDGSVSGDPGRIERAAVQMQGLPGPGPGDRKTARSLNNEALRALNAGDTNTAVEMLQRAALADSSDPEILGNLAWSYLRAGKPSVAFDAAVISLIHTPRRASSWGTLGIAMIQQNSVDMDRAVASLQNAYRYAGNPEKSREYFQQIAQQDDSPAVRKLGQAVLPTLSSINSIGLESERMKGR